MATTTVRGLVADIQREVRDTDLQPDRAADLLVKLTALIGNTNDEIRERDADYASVLLSFLEADEAANRAKIRAETTPAYQRKLCIELCRSLKYLLKAKSDELQMSRHM